MTLPMIFPDDEPRARRNDPITSHLAADTNDTAASRRAVLLILQAYGALAHHEIETVYSDIGGDKATPQRLRTAVAELVHRGVVEPVGESTTPHGRKCLTWALKTAA